VGPVLLIQIVVVLEGGESNTGTEATFIVTWDVTIRSVSWVEQIVISPLGIPPSANTITAKRYNGDLDPSMLTVKDRFRMISRTRRFN
jgi:hypothetical protein